MTSFYLYSVLFAVIALGFIIYPWLKDRNAKKRFEVSNTNVIKQRILEIEREASEGLIDPEEMQTAINEMKVALAEESAFQSAQQKEAEMASLSAKSAKIPLIIGAVPAIIAAAWVYVDANQLAGLKDLVNARDNIDELSQRISVKPANDVQADEFQKYALVIRQQLRKDPTDATGWQWLGRLRMTLGQTEEASQAFKKALDINPDNHEIRMQYAQSLMMRGDEPNLQNALRQMNYLVQIAPDNRNYRLLITVIAAQTNDRDIAFANFALIKDQLSANSSIYLSLVNQLRSMGASEELLALDEQGTDLAVQGLETSISGESNNSLQRSTSALPDTSGSIVSGFDVTVSLSDDLKGKLPQNGYLIVFAQDAVSGSKVPLAVRRLALPQLPISLSLTTEDAMLPNFSLKNAKQVTITARISADEDVMASTGELQGSVANVQVNDGVQAIELKINKEI
ncbi:MAG: cytochrome c-type biogenesis protein CcmI [Glaciecola sp.]